MKVKVDVRRAYRLINNGPVILVTSAFRDRRNVMTMAWHMPASMDPPLVAIALGETRYTWELVRGSEEFAINVPPGNLAEKVDAVGRVSGREVDKFREIGLTPEPAASVRAPLVGECIGHLECRVMNRYPAGDHFIVVGQVVAASVEEGLFDEAWLAAGESGKGPLHHLGGKRYSTLGSLVQVIS